MCIRAVGEAPFKPSDVRMLKSIAGFVAHSMTAVTLGEDLFAESEDRALFIADLDGTVQHANTPAQSLLTMALNPCYSPTANWAWSVRTDRRDWCSAARLRPPRTAQSGSHRQSCGAKPMGGFVLRGYWLGPTDGAEQTRQIAITIERRVPRALALRRRVEDLPLTARENNSACWWRRNPSRQDLADAMGVAVSTATTHQHSVYAKLDVHKPRWTAGLLQTEVRFGRDCPSRRTHAGPARSAVACLQRLDLIPPSIGGLGKTVQFYRCARGERRAAAAAYWPPRGWDGQARGTPGAALCAAATHCAPLNPGSIN